MGSNTQSAWTDECVSELRRLHAADQYSTTGIANALSQKFGTMFGRNAVIGKLHRLGLTNGGPGRRPTEKPKGEPKRHRRPHRPLPPLPKGQPTPPPPPFTARVADTAPLHLTILQVDNTSCKYECSGQDDPALFTFCGRTVFGETPWCADHARICFAPASDRRRAKIAVPA